MVIFLKPKDKADEVLTKISEFLAERKLEIKQEETRVVASTDGFDFLGWRFADIAYRRTGVSPVLKF